MLWSVSSSSRARLRQYQCARQIPQLPICTIWSTLTTYGRVWSPFSMCWSSTTGIRRLKCTALSWEAPGHVCISRHSGLFVLWSCSISSSHSYSKSMAQLATKLPTQTRNYLWVADWCAASKTMKMALSLRTWFRMWPHCSEEWCMARISIRTCSWTKY